MDWDEPISGSNQPMALGEVLDRLSLEELRSRIEALNNEISRVQAEIEKRQSHQAQVDQFFKN